MDAQQQLDDPNHSDQNSNNNIYQHTQEGKFFIRISIIIIEFVTDIEKYAVLLCMDITKYKELLYIAKQGLDAPISESWESFQDEEGEIYFVNTESAGRTYDHPLDVHFKEMFLKAKAEKECQ